MNEFEEKTILLDVIRYCKDGRHHEFQLLIEELQPYDIAGIYRNLPAKHHPKFLMMMEPKQLAELIQELELPLQADILQILGVKSSSEVLSLMEKDDLADLLSELSEESLDQLLASMKREESQHVQNLMQYPPDTAGGLMTNQYVWIRSYYTVQEAVDKLKSFASMAENLYYLYVLNEDNKLTGVVSYRDLLLADKSERIEEIMFSRVISVPIDADQEEVAKVIERYDFLSLPVVDEENRLLGIITVDDVIDVVIREADEDIGRLSATSGKTIDFTTGPLISSVRRLPWLILLLLLGLVSGSIISNFEETLNKVVALAFFMPMISGMTGNTGTQSLAIVVRGLVSQEPRGRVVFRLLGRELAVGIIIGVTCGLLVFVLGYVWQKDMVLALVVGSSLLFTLIIGTMAGTVIPLVLYRLRVDPAIASGPLITTLNDIFSLLIYFGLASFFIIHLL